jgi:hypothetical protein
MRRFHRVVLLAVLLAAAPVLAGCEDFDMDSLDVFGLNKKKPLPGERRDVFPGGVPGVTQGIPPEYLKSNVEAQQKAEAAATAEQQKQDEAKAAEDAQKKAAAAEEAAKPKPKPKKKVVRAPPKPPTQVTVQPVRGQNPQQAPWPAQGQQQGQQQSQQQGQQQQDPAWSSQPPPAGTFSR